MTRENHGVWWVLEIWWNETVRTQHWSCTPVVQRGKPKGKEILAQSKMLGDAGNTIQLTNFCSVYHFIMSMITLASPEFLWEEFDRYGMSLILQMGLTLIIHKRCTGVPTMHTRLIQGYEASATFTSAAKLLHLVMYGSSAPPLPVTQQWEQLLGIS